MLKLKGEDMSISMVRVLSYVFGIGVGDCASGVGIEGVRVEVEMGDESAERLRFKPIVLVLLFRMMW